MSQTDFKWDQGKQRAEQHVVHTTYKPKQTTSKLISVLKRVGLGLWGRGEVVRLDIFVPFLFLTFFIYRYISLYIYVCQLSFPQLNFVKMF